MTTDIKITYCNDIFSHKNTPIIMDKDTGKSTLISSITFSRRAYGQNHMLIVRLCAERMHGFLLKGDTLKAFDPVIFYSDRSPINEYQYRRMKLPGWKKYNDRKLRLGTPLLESPMVEREGIRTAYLYATHADRLGLIQQEFLNYPNAFLFFLNNSLSINKKELTESIYRYGMSDAEGRPLIDLQWHSLVAKLSKYIVPCRSFYDDYDDTVGIDVFISEEQRGFINGWLDDSRVGGWVS